MLYNSLKPDANLTSCNYRVCAPCWIYSMFLFRSMIARKKNQANILYFFLVLYLVVSTNPLQRSTFTAARSLEVSWGLWSEPFILFLFLVFSLDRARPLRGPPLFTPISNDDLPRRDCLKNKEAENEGYNRQTSHLFSLPSPALLVPSSSPAPCAEYSINPSAHKLRTGDSATSLCHWFFSCLKG